MTDLAQPLPRLVFDSPIVVIDVESTGLDIRRDFPVEVAWANLATGQRGEFIPAHDPAEVLRLAHPRALAVNNYRERIYHGQLAIDHDGSAAAELFAQFTSKTYLAGAQAGSYDQWMVAKLWPAVAWDALPWSYRVFDVSNMAMQELGLDWLPGLTWIAEELDIGLTPDHTAMGDVEVTAAVLAELIGLRDSRLGIRRDTTGARVDCAPELCELSPCETCPSMAAREVVATVPDRATLRP